MYKRKIIGTSNVKESNNSIQKFQIIYNPRCLLGIASL